MTQRHPRTPAITLHRTTHLGLASHSMVETLGLMVPVVLWADRWLRLRLRLNRLAGG